jgi:hypothetical protein
VKDKLKGLLWRKFVASRIFCPIGEFTFVSAVKWRLVRTGDLIVSFA